MKVVLAALYVVLGCVLAIPIGMAALIGLAAFWKPDFDRAHPDYALFAERFAAAQRALDAGERAEIDLAPVNGGAWHTACLFGGYSWPVARMDALGAMVSDADRRRLAKPIGMRVSPVEESEMLIAFIDEGQRAHFVHFRGGLGPGGQHYEACVRKPQTKVAIAAEARARPPLP